MAAYRRVYDSCLLPADCPGSAFYLCADNCSIGTAWQHRHHRCHGNVNTTMAHSLTHKSAGAHYTHEFQFPFKRGPKVGMYVYIYVYIYIYKWQIGFIFLVSAHPGSPGQRTVKRVCVYLSRYTHTHRRTLVIHTVCGVPTEQGHRVSVLAHVPQRQRSVLSAGRHDVRLRGMNVDAVKRHSITRADTLPHT